MDEYIKVIIKEPGRAPFEIEIQNDLTVFQDFLGGNIQRVKRDDSYVMLVGRAVWVGVDGKDFVSVGSGLLEEVAEETGYNPDSGDIIACGDLENLRDLRDLLDGTGLEVIQV